MTSAEAGTQGIRSWGTIPGLGKPWPPGTLAVAAAILGIALAEFITTYINPLAGVAIHVLLLVCFLSAAGLLKDQPRANLYLVLALAPLIRIVSLSMPLGRLPQAYWYVLVAVPVFASAVAVARRARLSLAELGLRLPARSSIPLEISVVALGPLFGVVEWQILHSKPITHGSSLILAAGAGLILLVFTGFFEEFVFRGLFQRVAGRLLGPAAGLVCTATVFVILHIGWRSVYDMVFVLAIALYFGYVVLRSGSILGVSISHGAINVVLFIVLPLTLVPAVRASVANSGRPMAGMLTGPDHAVASGTLIRLAWPGAPFASVYELRIGTAQARHGHYVIRQLRVHRRGARLRLVGRQWYFWQVRALVLGLWQPYSNRQHVLVARPRAVAPRGLSYSLVRNARRVIGAKLCWGLVKGAESYRILVRPGIRRTGARDCLSLQLAPGRRYLWRVAALVRGERVYRGPFSSAEFVTTPASHVHH